MTRSVLQLCGPSTGGIRRHVAVVSSMLRERGWRVVTAAPSGVLDGLEIDVSVVDVPDGMAPGPLLGAVRSFRRLGDFDIIHAHGLKAGWVAVLARPTAPIVLTVHNVVLRSVAGRTASIQRFLERAVVRRVDRVIAVSPEIVEHFGGVVAADRIRFVLPASASPEPRRTREQIRAALGVDESTILVVVVARLHPQKDLLMFLDAWQRVRDAHPDASALIVGDGPQRGELESAIIERGLGGAVRLMGASDYAVDEISAADLVAMSSRWEGAPLVVAETMQLGIPMVSTDVGVVGEMLGEGGVIVPVGDAVGFAEAISGFIDSADRRRIAGGIGRTRGSVIYGAASLVDEIVGVYDEVLSQ